MTRLSANFAAQKDTASLYFMCVHYLSRQTRNLRSYHNEITLYKNNTFNIQGYFAYVRSETEAAWPHFVYKYYL